MKATLLICLGASIVTKALADEPTVPALAPLWGQCGGYAYIKFGLGPTQCVAGAYCQDLGFYYAQCQPIPSTAPAPTPAPALN